MSLKRPDTHESCGRSCGRRHPAPQAPSLGACAPDAGGPRPPRRAHMVLRRPEIHLASCSSSAGVMRVVSLSTTLFSSAIWSLERRSCVMSDTAFSSRASITSNACLRSAGGGSGSASSCSRIGSRSLATKLPSRRDQSFFMVSRATSVSSTSRRIFSCRISMVTLTRFFLGFFDTRCMPSSLSMSSPASSASSRSSSCASTFLTSS
mmetsp:Transcript_109870/g.310872  ORF Transcript_109870/g.310872 Transcript_109870/m.310872 type:complete len:207 (+) Transcript_109870:203-823(+)